MSGGGGIPACTEADPPLWTESQTPVKTLPWPNFVAAGNGVRCIQTLRPLRRNTYSGFHRIFEQFGKKYSDLSGADPGFGQGGAQLPRPKVADRAERSSANKAIYLWPGSRAHLRALEAFGFLNAQICILHILETKFNENSSGFTHKKESLILWEEFKQVTFD